MLEFVISNYIVFIVIAVVLLLGLFGYIVDKKKYVQYREEIANEEKVMNTLESQPNIQNVAAPVMIDNSIPDAGTSNSNDPITESIQK